MIFNPTRDLWPTAFITREGYWVFDLEYGWLAICWLPRGTQS